MCIQAFDGKNLRDRRDLEDPGLDGSITLKSIFKKWEGA
jgi:hypothetical protein